MSQPNTGMKATTEAEREKMGEDLAQAFEDLCKKDNIRPADRMQIAYCAFYAMQRKARGMQG